MAPRSDNPPVIAIVGETASGKTALALALAALFPGEIIAADSRTIYKGMDIGTAKPSRQEQDAIHHYGIDLVTPDEQFTAADFKRMALNAIKDIAERHKVAYVVGGTGLYIDGLIYDFQFRPKGNADQRAVLEKMTAAELQQALIEKGIRLPENKQNPRHLIRSLETEGVATKRSTLRPNTLIIGMRIDRNELLRKLNERVNHMIADGFVDEVRSLSARYGWSAPALQAPGYKAFKQYLEGSITLEEAKSQFVRNDAHLAKRQRTWFSRNKDINWIGNMEEAVDLVTTFLNK